MTALDRATVEAVMSDWRTAPIDEKLRTTLAFLEKLTQPDQPVGPEEIAHMRNAGVSDAAIEDAIYVCFCFNVLTRLADTFDFEVYTPAQFEKEAEKMLKFGYNIASM